MPAPGPGPADEPALTPAKLTDRFLAYLVDGALFLAAWALLARRVAAGGAPPQAARTLALALLAVYLVYQAAGNLAGATLGKRLFGLRVVDLEGRRPGPLRALLRALGYLLSTPLFNLGFVWSLFHPTSRAWHDLLAGTVVVESRPRSPGGSLAVALLAFSALGAILGFDLWFYWLKPTPRDREALAKAREGLRVLAQIEEAHRAQHGTYTDKLAELAQTSGDVPKFKEAFGELFDPDGFKLRSGKTYYMLRARAKDRRRTEVALSGP